MKKAEVYAKLIRFGRMLSDHRTASRYSKEHPGIVLSFVNAVDQELLWTSIDDFFSLFPPIKRYEEDGTWDFNSTIEMRNEFGTKFGKDEFKELLMSRCYENKWIHLVGFSFMLSISRTYEYQTGRNVLSEFFAQKNSL